MPNIIEKLIKKNIKLNKNLATKLVNSTMFNRPKMNVVINLQNIRQAFNSKQTSDITKGVILSHLLDDSIDYNKLLSNEFSSTNIGIQLNNSRNGYYFTLTNEGKTLKIKDPLTLSILKSNQLKTTTNKLFKGLLSLKDKTTFNKAFNASLWINSYLGQLSKIADFIRSYIRTNDPEKLWYEGESPLYHTKDHIYRFESIQELDDTNIVLLLARQDLHDLKNEVSRFDWFAGSLKKSEQHETLKAFLDSSIMAIDDIANGKSPDTSIIDTEYLERIQNNPNIIDSELTYNQSLLNGILATIGDWIVYFGEEDLLNVNFNDNEIVENLVEIHGNLQPPTVTDTSSRSEFLSVNPRNSNDFRKVSQTWKRRFK